MIKRKAILLVLRFYYVFHSLHYFFIFARNIGLYLSMMKKTILIYGVSLAILALLLKYIEFKVYLRSMSMELYAGIIAGLFTAIGIWMGLKLTKTKVIVQKEMIKEDFVLNENNFKQIGLSEREYEVLQLMAQGLSNKEIAVQLFISLNTVKTHASNLFIKLDVKRRTQAVQRGKELELIA